MELRSPLVTHVSWGRIDVGPARYKDAKLFPGGSREWDWNETGTEHDVGVQLSDVQELIDRGARVIVISRGMYERLEVRDDLVAALRDRGVEVHVAKTLDAVALYNILAEQGPVGALFHTTC